MSVATCQRPVKPVKPVKPAYRLYLATFARDVPPVAFGVSILMGNPVGRQGWRAEFWRDADGGGWCVRTGKGHVFLMDDGTARTYLVTTRRDGRPVDVSADVEVQMTRAAVGDLRGRERMARTVQATQGKDEATTAATTSPAPRPTRDQAIADVRRYFRGVARPASGPLAMVFERPGSGGWSWAGYDSPIGRELRGGGWIDELRGIRAAAYEAVEG